MKKILVGSTAINANNPNKHIRIPKDEDYFVSGVGFKENINKKDTHGIPEDVFSYIWDRSSHLDDNIRIASNDILYTIKISHSLFPIKWQKTQHDILWLKNNVNTNLDNELFEKLYNFWLTIHKHNKDSVNLNKPNQEFFKDHVKRDYVHDDIHKAISHPETPMYLQMKSNKDLALLRYEDFIKFSYKKQLKLCEEEIYVTAIERFVIPLDFIISDKVAYKYAAEKLVTSMSKGWFPKFIMKNWHILHKPKIDYIDKFKVALDNERVKQVA